MNTPLVRPADDLSVEKCFEGKTVAHFRVSRGYKGGDMVTVRVGINGIYVCLTCCVSDCQHADAARDFDKVAA